MTKIPCGIFPHIPGNYALSREETTAFLNSLIASLE